MRAIVTTKYFEIGDISDKGITYIIKDAKTEVNVFYDEDMYIDDLEFETRMNEFSERYLHEKITPNLLSEMTVLVNSLLQRYYADRKLFTASDYFNRRKMMISLDGIPEGLFERLMR